MRTEDLLSQSQSLAEELTNQQEELRETNTRLEKQAATLQESEELLRRQQEELKRANEELQRKAQQLSSQKAAVEGKNREIELAKLALQERAEQLALTSKYKSEFLANMSHELRTPLNSLLILAEMLAENLNGNLSPKQREFAQTIYAAGSDLLALINDILDMAKIESGTMTVDVDEVPFPDLREYVERTFRPVAESKDLQFDVGLAGNLPRAIYTDSKRLQQVLRNLLSNAFKFTEHGKVSLWIEVAKIGWSPDHPVLNRSETVVAFAVSDTGIGIPADRLKVIFEPFQQADMGTGRRFGGTGLGLSISREIARLLGGEIQVVSEPGKGSTFTLLLPALGSHPHRLAPSSPAPSTPGETLVIDEASEAAGYPSLAGSRIVIVDDDVRNVYALTSALEDRGVEVLTAEDGRQGIDLLQKTAGVDLVLMDIMMPEMDGYETTRAIRKMPGFKDLPIIALTAKAMRGDREKSLAAGASDYITKPVEINQLLALMLLWLER
jgi:signal transduction histidine kinase